MIDLVSELRRIMNSSNAETFDQTTDSLEALRDWLILAAASLNVPAPNGLINLLERDVIGNKLDTPVLVPDNVSSLMRYAKGILNTLNAMVTRPSVSLYEGWQDELGIDFTLWTVTNPVAGAAWVRGAFGESLMATSAPAANNNARLRSNQRWIAGPDNYGPNKIITRFTLEFEAQFTNVANFDNANFLLGLTYNVGDTRTALNIVGWTLVGAGNALQTLSRAGGAETSFTGFGENLALTNKFKIELFQFAPPAVGYSLWYLNDVLVATHVFNNPSNAPMWINFYAPAGAGGPATIRLGIIRAWTAD